MSIVRTVEFQPSTPPKPDPKTVMNIMSKVKRIYEDGDWVIDLIDGKVRVSYFEDNHFVDEIVLSSDYFKDRRLSDG